MSDVSIIGYRIVEMKNNIPYSLFHGTQRSRKLPVGIWHKADKKVVHDGTNGKEYLSGFHFFSTYKHAKDAFDRMFSKKPNRYIIKARFRGDIRIKNNSRKGRCWLADEMFIEPLDLKDLK